MDTFHHKPQKYGRKVGWQCAFVVLMATLACAPPIPPQGQETQRLRGELQRAFDIFGAPAMREAFVALLKPPDQEWTSMRRDQKRRVMDQHIMPIMTAFYIRYRQLRIDASKAQAKAVSKKLPNEIDCKTCHGGGPSNQFEPDFSKPTTLYPLDPDNMPTENSLDPYTAATVKYMKNIVTPAMRILLNRPNMTCFGCHATKSSK